MDEDNDLDFEYEFEYILTYPPKETGCMISSGNINVKVPYSKYRHLNEEDRMDYFKRIIARKIEEE